MKIKKSELLFFLTWFIYLFFSIICYETEFKHAYNLSIISRCYPFIVGILLMTIILNSKIVINKLPIIVISGIIVFISAFFSHSTIFIWIFLFALAFGNIEFDRFIKFDFAIRWGILLFVWIMCAMGVIDNYKIVISGIPKQGLGFAHPNTLGIYVVVLAVEYIYIFFTRLDIKKYIMLILVWLFLFNVGTSRTSIFLLAFVIVFTIISKKLNGELNKKYKIFSTLTIILPILIAAICYYFAIFYDRSKEIWIVLNKFLTTRITWANYYYMQYGVSLFGTDINPISSRYAEIHGLSSSNSFDMGYVRIGVEFGLLVFVIFIFAQVNLHKYIIKANKICLLICNMFFLLLGMFENSMYSIYMNVFLILMVQPFFQRVDAQLQEDGYE